MASSIDGFIASFDGRVDWIDTKIELEKEYKLETFLNHVDTIFMGRKSYEQAVSFGEWPWLNHRVFVFSKIGLRPKTPHTEIILNPNPDFVSNLKMGGGKNIWLFGGGILNHYFLEKNLIDEMMLFVQPVILGKGVGIFGNKLVDPKKWIRIESKELRGGFTLLHYQFTS